MIWTRLTSRLSTSSICLTHRAPRSLPSTSIKTVRRLCSNVTDQSRVSSKYMMSDNDDFYRFTRGRFVQNEIYEMASRYVRFNVEELMRKAADATGSRDCVRIEKLADGMHNKAFLLTMDSGAQVVAKIPNPNAGQAHHTTASEVATMDYMRNVLGTPVPKVYSWCSHAENSPVGSEYIIMEKAAGVPLQSVWPKLDLNDRFSLIKDIVRLQVTWSSASYQNYGSIYYACDLPEQLRLPLASVGHDTMIDEKFVLGPTNGRDWIDDGRQSVTFDRGPWKTVESYLEAVGRREMTCARELSRLPPTQVTLCGPGTYQSSREKKLRAIGYYLQLFEYLVPEDPSVYKPSAWHGDLHGENVYVDVSEPTKVSCIIDWQSTEVAPLFVQARQPYILDHDGPPAVGLERPLLPSNFAELSVEAQSRANRLLLDQSLCIGYKRWIQGRAPDIWKSFEFQETPAFELLQLARTLLVDGEAIYMARIVEHLQTSDSVVRLSGLTIPENVRAEINVDSEGAIRGMEAMASIREALGDLFPQRGCVKTEQYEEAKDALRQCKQQILDSFANGEAERIAWEASWPFDD